MKSARLFFAVATLAMAFLLTCAVTTANASHKSAPPPPPVDGRILIDSVDASSKTVVFKYMRDGSNHTYSFDDLSVIKVGDASSDPTTVDQIKVGMQVRDYVERDSHILDSIIVSPAAPAPTNPPPQ